MGKKIRTIKDKYTKHKWLLTREKMLSLIQKIIQIKLHTCRGFSSPLFFRCHQIGKKPTI